MDNTITDHELTEFVRRAEEAANAYLRGDVDHYLDLLHHANGFTLLRPNGGPASRHEERAAELRSWPNPFRDGEARLEHVETHTWGDTLVLVMIDVSMHGWAICPTRTSRCGSPTCTAAMAPTGDWSIVMRTRSCSLWSCPN